MDRIHKICVYCVNFKGNTFRAGALDGICGVAWKIDDGQRINPVNGDKEDKFCSEINHDLNCEHYEESEV